MVPLENIMIVTKAPISASFRNARRDDYALLADPGKGAQDGDYHQAACEDAGG